MITTQTVQDQPEALTDPDGGFFVYAEMATSDRRRWDDYLPRWGFVQVGDSFEPDTSSPGYSCTEYRRGSFPLLVTRHCEGTPLWPRLQAHGDFISDVGLALPDHDVAFTHAETAGATAVQRWGSCLGGASYYRRIQGPGVTHTLYKASDVRGQTGPDVGKPGNFDHMALVVPYDQRKQAIQTYKALFGEGAWHPMDPTPLRGGETMGSCYFTHGLIKLTIVWPEGKCAQLDNFLRQNGGTGIQHLAIGVPDIVEAITDAQSNHVGFVDAPDAYYAGLVQRLGDTFTAKDLDRWKQVCVLYDQDEWGGILQRFAKSIDGWPGFFEAIDRSRRGRTFGGGNVRALADALAAEIEEELRRARLATAAG